MTTMTLPLAPNAKRTPTIDTARADHWAPREQQAARPRTTDTMRIEHWTLGAAPAAAGTGSAQPQVDPWHGLDDAYHRVVAGERSLGHALRARWSAWRARRALARAEAEILAAARADERVLCELRIARDLAEWKIV